LLCLVAILLLLDKWFPDPFDALSTGDRLEVVFGATTALLRFLSPTESAFNQMAMMPVPRSFTARAADVLAG
jgi:hypothetical protein